MNSWFRVIYLMLVARFRKPVFVMDACTTPFTCWPSDLDTLLHMNNSRYLTIMDLARVDLIIRCGMWPKLQQNGHYPIVEAQTIRYRKSLKLWQSFNIVTKIESWDTKSFFITQTFVRNGDVIAEAIVKGRFLKRTRGTVPPAEIMQMAGWNQPAPHLNPAISSWNEDLNTTKQS